MMLQLSMQLRDQDGKLLTQAKPTLNNEGVIIGQTQEPVLLGNLVKAALLQPDEKDSADEKVTKFELMLRVSAAKDGELDLESEDITLVKKLVGKMYAPLVVGQVYRILEGKPTGLEQE